ncbi:MAG: 2OG-Fe(II) oxygenase [bacterium]
MLSDTIHPKNSFFKLLELNVSEVEHHPDAFNRLRHDEVQGIMVHGIYPQETLQSVVQRLEHHTPPFLQTWFPQPFRSFFYGQNLNLSPPDLSAYFRETPAFQQQLAQLFPSACGITDYFAGILSGLDHNRPVLAPQGPNPGEHYMFTTIRAHLEGGYIPPHFDNEQALRPSYRHLLTLIHPHIYSFVLAFTRAESGGALEIFNHQMEPAGSTIINDDHHKAKFDLNELESVSFRIPPGSVLIVDSGRFLHRLTPVQGPQKRWTVCSFMALSRDANSLYCWG